MEIKIPFLGDGIETANVIAILAEVGEDVESDQTILELETDKATAPVPIPVAGKIESILVKEGDVVKEGMVFATIHSDVQSSPSQDSSESSAPINHAPPVPQKEAPAPVVQTIDQPYQLSGDIQSVNAAPSIKKFAKLSGLDLLRVNGTGTGGRVTWEDISNYVAFLQSKAFSSSESNETSEVPKRKSTVPEIDFSKFGPVDIVKLTSLRQKIASHLSHAWNEIPHVTQFADINIDSIMALRKKHNASIKKNEMKLTVTIFIIRAIVETLKEFPNFNSSLRNDELVIKQYYHMGVAVDTDSGLVVPVIKDVDKKSLNDVAVELDELAEKARKKLLAVTDIQGATFTLSNLGGLGASHFTPIVNHPEVAILGTGRAKFVANYDEKTKTVVNHLMMPIGLSYDHRVIDGADGARFVQALTNNIQNFDKKWIK